MSRTYLRDAGDALAEAADETTKDAAADRLSGLADQLHSLAERERGPDHGRLARIQSALDEVESGLTDGQGDEAAAAAIERARQQISEYRSGVEGV
ncbi:MAG: hypothetical protein ABEJ06_03990 [Haloarculaceae archaeon]